MNNLSIVIVSWNTASLLAACLRSIYDNPPSTEYDVWVVDNNSTDASVALIRANFSPVRILENSANVGFSQANNQAIEASCGRFVLLLNPDTVVHPGALDILLRFMDEHPEAGAVGARYLNPDGSLQTSCAPFPTLKREFWRLLHLDQINAYGVYDMAKWRTDEPRSVDVLQGACLLIRRDALDQVGLLDPGYFMYTEETDICFRLHKAGWKLVWVPDAVITHYGGQSTKQAALTMFLALYRSKIIFFRKHYGKVSAWLYKNILYLSALIRILGSTAARLVRPGNREHYVKTAGNYLQLLKSLSDY